MPLHRAAKRGLELTIGFGVLELPSWNLVFKQYINFTECTILIVSFAIILEKLNDEL